MMTTVAAESSRAEPISRKLESSLRAPSSGVGIPATAVRVLATEGTPSIEWLPDRLEPAKLALGADFSADAILRSRRDVDRNPRSLRARTNLAQALWQAGQVEESSQLCEDVLEQDSAQPAAILLLARLREVQGRSDEATALYEKAHRLRPSDVPPLLGLAQAAIRRGDLDAAVDYLRKATELNPSAGVPRLNLGLLFLRLGRPNEAIAQFKSAARADVRSPVLHHALGVGYWARHDYHRAERHFQTAIHLLPTYAPAVRSLAQLLMQQKRVAEAIDLLQAFLAHDGEHAALRELAGKALFERGEFRRAVEHLASAFNLMEKGEATQKDLARVANNIGVCQARQLHWKVAETWYERALILEPGQREAQHNLGRAYLATGQFDRSIALLSRASGEDSEAAFIVATARERKGDYEGVIAELARVIARPDAPDGAFVLLGNVLADESDSPARAVAVLREGVRRYPSSRLMANNLAYAMLLAGEIGEARTILEATPFDVEPESTTSMCLRATWGLLHIREGDLERGLAGYREAVRLAEEYGETKLARRARQKMHVEAARYFQERGDLEAAAAEIRLGMSVEGSSSYYRQLRQLKESLPG